MVIMGLAIFLLLKAVVPNLGLGIPVRSHKLNVIGHEIINRLRKQKKLSR